MDLEPGDRVRGHRRGSHPERLPVGIIDENGVAAIGLIIPSTDLRIDPYGAAMTHAVSRAAVDRDLGLMLRRHRMT